MRGNITFRALFGALALAGGVLAAGCSSTPTLMIQSVSPQDKGAQVFFRPSHDGQGNELPQTTPETRIGELPTEWEIPENLLGGRGIVRVVYPDDVQNTANISILRRADTVVRIAKPPVPRK